MKRLLLCLSIFAAAPAFADDAPGLMERNIPAPHHDRDMMIAVWYPATGTPTETFAANPVFKGGDVLRDAPLPTGKHPIVLLSHGMGGSYLTLNWLASGLAAKGAIVVSVNHPNGWFKDRDKVKMFDHWTRVQDLQVALNHVLSDTALGAIVDPQQVYAAGFSFGGWTALSIGGATADVAGSMTYCSAAGERSHNCMDLQHLGYDPAKANPQKWTASWKDARVKSVVALDPGLTWSMTSENVMDLDQTRLLVIGLGNVTERHFATDTTTDGSKFDTLVPKAKIEVISPATHFTAMPLCTPEGAALLAAEKDDPVCTDPHGTDRKAVHDRIISLMAKHFGLI